MIESLLALLAGRGDEADFHDRYAQGLAAVVRAELALVVECTEGQPVAVLGRFGDKPAAQALFEALPPTERARPPIELNRAFADGLRTGLWQWGHGDPLAWG